MVYTQFLPSDLPCLFILAIQLTIQTLAQLKVNIYETALPSFNPVCGWVSIILFFISLRSSICTIRGSKTCIKCLQCKCIMSKVSFISVVISQYIVVYRQLLRTFIDAPSVYIRENHKDPKD